MQRVESAAVRVEGKEIARIRSGLATLLGVAKGDTEETLEKMMHKIVHLRVFPDHQQKMNLSLLDTSGEHLIVSQFTLLGDCRKGHRPSFVEAEEPEWASFLFGRAVEISRAMGAPTQGGRFQAMMDVELVNQGPVTLVLDLPAPA